MKKSLLKWYPLIILLRIPEHQKDSMIFKAKKVAFSKILELL